MMQKAGMIDLLFKTIAPSAIGKLLEQAPMSKS
jgi:hypothetical protein